jgi:hypothetical protein
LKVDQQDLSLIRMDIRHTSRGTTPIHCPAYRKGQKHSARGYLPVLFSYGHHHSCDVSRHIHLNVWMSDHEHLHNGRHHPDHRPNTLLRYYWPLQHIPIQLRLAIDT